MTQATTQLDTCRALLQLEIERFGRYARLRCTADAALLRRSHIRYHRTWPLVVARLAGGGLREHSAALYDASAGGIGFMSDHSFDIDELLFVRLFWHDARALRIPAVVRHRSPGVHGVLTGAEFALDDPQACELALALEQAGAPSPPP